MRLSEERISHISHLIIEALKSEKICDFTQEGKALHEIKKNITNFLQFEDRADEAARQKIRSMSSMVAEGGREWDILYRKYFNEEMAKKGF